QRAALALRPGALRDRDLRPRPLPFEPVRSGPRARLGAAVLRRGREGVPGRDERRLRAAVARRLRHHGGRPPDRLRGRGAPCADQQLRRARRRGATPARGHRVDGQRHDRSRGRRRRARLAGGSDRRPGRGEDPLRGGGPKDRHHQLRDHLRDLVPGPPGARPLRGAVTGAIAERLARSPAVRACREALGSAPGAWIVGGATRDAALGREVTDVDLVVARGEREAARSIARVTGGAMFQLSGEFATWRTLGPGGAWHVDVVRLRGARIEDDLGQRDFTVNAIAIPVADLNAAPIDPHSGLADLRARRLAAVSERSFADDPLRVLRAARIAAGLALEIEPRAVELARA